METAPAGEGNPVFAPSGYVRLFVKTLPSLPAISNDDEFVALYGKAHADTVAHRVIHAQVIPVITFGYVAVRVCHPATREYIQYPCRIPASGSKLL